MARGRVNNTRSPMIRRTIRIGNDNRSGFSRYAKRVVTIVGFGFNVCTPRRLRHRSRATFVRPTFAISTRCVFVESFPANVGRRVGEPTISARPEISRSGFGFWERVRRTDARASLQRLHASTNPEFAIAVGSVANFAPAGLPSFTVEQSGGSDRSTSVEMRPANVARDLCGGLAGVELVDAVPIADVTSGVERTTPEG